MNEELDSPVNAASMSGMKLRQVAENVARENAVRLQQVQDDLNAWQVGNEPEDEASLFPPLETILNGLPRDSPFGGGNRHRRHPGFGFGGPQAFPPPRVWDQPRQTFGAGGFRGGDHPPHHRRHHDGIRNLFDRVSDVVNNPPSPAALVPTQEIKAMLDGFLANLTNQLAGTFEGSTRLATSQETENERPIPGAFVRPQSQPQSQSPVQTQADAQSQTQPPVSMTESENVRLAKVGKGGFRHKHISCDGCLTGIRGMRYKCEVCCFRLFLSMYAHAP